CEQLSDRMPAVARDEEWTAEERAHLGACADCSAEWALIRSTRALGADVVADLNAHHVTERVLGRLRAARAVAGERRRWLAVAGLAAAAALARARAPRDPRPGGRPGPAGRPRRSRAPSRGGPPPSRAAGRHSTSLGRISCFPNSTACARP